jgi:hypothetical protein
MKEFESHDRSTEGTRERRVQIKELVQEVAVEMSRLRASLSTSEVLDTADWERAQRFAHNLAVRAQTLKLGVLASCARELERFAGAIASSDLPAQSAAQGAAIAIDTIDLELGALSTSEGLT